MAMKKIALFIDADNVSARFGKKIIDSLEGRGELFIRRIYGNWEKIPLRGWNDCILNYSLRAVQQPDFVTGKNATDMSLTIDAMDVLHDGKADIFALVSNDSDFTPLVIRLREGGMTIIGLGNSNASNAFRAACSEFIDLNATKPAQTVTKPPVAVKKDSVQLSLFDTENAAASKPPTPPPPLTPQPPPPQPKPANPKVVPITVQKNPDDTKYLQPVHDILRETVDTHGDDQGFVALCWAGQSIRENLSFSIKDLGYNSLHSFISAFPDRYEVILRDGGENFCYRCRGYVPKKQSPETAPLEKLDAFHDAMREATASFSDKDGFANLCSVGTYVTQKKLGFGVKNLGYSNMQKFIAAFPDRYEVRKDGNKILLRCRAKAQPPDDRINQLHKILHETAAAHADESGFTDLSHAGNCLGKQKIGFGIRSLGYSTLQKFVADFPDLYAAKKVAHKIFYRCLDDKAQKLPDDKAEQLHEILHLVARVHAGDDGFVRLQHACEFILSNENTCGDLKAITHNQLRDFVSNFPDLYAVVQGATDREFMYRCRTAKKTSNDDKLNQLHEVLRESAEAHADAAGFSLLNYAGQELKSKKLGFGIKDFGYRQLREFVSDFPDLYETAQDNAGQNFRYRCRQ